MESERLKLQLLTVNDAEKFFDLTQDQGFLSFLITDWRQKSLDSARDWIAMNEKAFRETKFGVFGVVEKASDQLVGIAALRVLNLDYEDRPEVTYRFRESTWGKGYATEVAKILLEYGFKTLDLREIGASITPDNIPSKKVALKLGMKYTNNEKILGFEAEIYRIQRDEYLSRKI